MKQSQPRSTKDGSCLQKLEERPGMGSSLEPHGPSGTLTLNLTYLSFWVCSSSETLRQGDTDSSSQDQGERPGRWAGGEAHLPSCTLFFPSAPNPLLAFTFKSKSSHRMPNTSLPQPAGSISAQAPERACTRCRLSHSCFPCNRLSSPRIPHHIRLDLGHVSSV